MPWTNWKKYVEDSNPPLDPGEELIDARWCTTPGLTRQRAFATAGAAHASGGAIGGAISGGLKAIAKEGFSAIRESVASKGRGPDTERLPTEADRLPPGDIVIAVTSKRYRLYRPTRGLLQWKLEYLREEPLDWVSDCRLELRLSAPLFFVTFRDGSSAKLEVPRESRGSAKDLVNAIRGVNLVAARRLS